MAGRTGGVTVTISGMNRLAGRLEELPAELIDACKAAIRASAEAVREDTRAAVRVNTGRLRDTVAIEYEDEGLTARVGWHDPQSYYAAFHEHGTRRMPAKPALGPALEAERPKLRDRVSGEVRRAVEG